MKRETIIGIIAFLILIALFFNKVIFDPQNSATINADLLRMTSLWEGQINEDLRNNNELILWNADVFSGTPLIGSPLTTMFYPLSIVFYFLPFHVVHPYMMAINLFLMGIFFYMYLRLIKISKFSSFFSVVIFVFSGIVVLWSGIASFINALIWFPLLLYLTERLILEKRAVFGLLIGLLFGVQILGSGPQIFLYSCFVLFLYIALRLLYERKFILRTTCIFALAAIIGMVIGAVQLIPMLEYSKYSIRDTGLSYDIATMHSLPGYAMITFLVPEFYGRGNLYWGFWKNSSFTEQYIYIGLVTLMLLIIALFFIRKNKYATIFSIIAAFSLLFSLGKYTPFYSIFYSLPLFNSFRAPVRMMVFFVFSAAVISGFSLDRITELDEEKKKILKKIILAIGLILIIAAIFTLIAYLYSEQVIRFGNDLVKNLYEKNISASRITRNNLSLDYFLNLIPSIFKNIISSIGIFLIITSSILLAFYFWLESMMRAKHLKLLLLLILVFELFIFSSKFVAPGKFEEKFATSPIIDAIKNDNEIFRVLSLRNYQSKDNLPQYLATYNNIQLASGCDAIFLKKYAEYSCLYGNCEIKADACIPIQEVKYTKMIDLLNIKYVVSTKELDENMFEFVLNYNGANLYKNKNYLARAFFVPKIEYSENKEETLRMIADAKFNPKVYAIIEGNESEVSTLGKGDYKGLNIANYTQNKVLIEEEFADEGFVVLNDVNYPGWKAYVDGKEVKLYNTDYILKGIYVDEGKHSIEFVYRPLSYKAGLYTSLIGFILAIIITAKLLMD